jgi:hypothetical protein
MATSDEGSALGGWRTSIAGGVVGAILHFEHDLASGSRFVPERLLRGAPFMAPLRFCNMALVGLLALLPREGGAAAWHHRPSPRAKREMEP